jgi:hypothetical protein
MADKKDYNDILDPDVKVSEWLFKGNGFETLGRIGTGVKSVFDLYTGLKGLGLAQETFDYNKKLTSTNLANQATLINATNQDRYTQLASWLGADRAKEMYGDMNTYLQNHNVATDINGTKPTVNTNNTNQQPTDTYTKLGSIASSKKAAPRSSAAYNALSKFGRI